MRQDGRDEEARSDTRLVLASALAYVALTAIIGRRVLASLTTAIASDAGDPVLNAAILAWNATHVPWTEPWFQFPIFYPAAGALTLSEHLLGASLVASPVYWLTGNALAAYNVTFLLSYPLCGLAMYALVWRLTRSAPAAFLAGLAYALAPFRTSHLPHIQVLLSFWAPLALLGLHGLLEARLKPYRRWSWLALFAVCWVLQGASNGYFLVYFTVLVGLWVLWFLARPGRWRDAGLVAAAGAIALVPLAPILYRYVITQRALGLSRNLGEIAAFSADIAAPLCAPAGLTFWGWLRVACAQEGELFAGAALVVLCVAGASGARGAREARGADGDGEGRVRVGVRRTAIALALAYVAIALSVFVAGPWRLDAGWLRASASTPDKPMTVALLLLLVAFLLSPSWRRTWRRGSTATFYLIAALVCWVLSWGPFPRLFGAEALYQAPYAWLLQLPGIGGLRAPSRFWMMTVLCLIVFMGIGVARLLSRSSRRGAAAIVVVATVGLVADGLTTIPVAAVQAAARNDDLRGATVLVLPAGTLERDIATVYHAVAGGWRSINGYSGYEPAHYEALRTLSQARDAALFAPFRALGDLQVLVEEGDLDTLSLVERQPGVTRVRDSVGTGVRTGTTQRHYRLPALPVDETAPAPIGQRLGVRPVAASCSPEGLRFAVDDDLETAWVCGIQTAAHHATFELAGETTVGAVVHALGPFGAAFPRHLVIETSVDGERWDDAWDGSPASAVLEAALVDPRSTRAILPFAPRRARFIRLRQTGRHDINYWSIAELEVWSGS